MLYNLINPLTNSPASLARFDVNNLIYDLLDERKMSLSFILNRELKGLNASVSVILTVFIRGCC